MDNYRAILAIVLAFFILLGYQYLFVGTEQEQPLVEETVEVQQPKVPVQEEQLQAVPAAIVSADQAVEFEQPVKFEEPASLPSQAGKDIVVETDAFTAVITETGGGVKSFKLNRFNETTDSDSERKELISTESFTELPLYFSWGVDPGRAQIPLFASDKETLKVEAGESQTLTMTAQLSSGLQVTRRLVFDPDSYLIKMSVDIYNFSETALQGSPYMSLTNLPFGASAQRYFFFGPAALIDGKLEEIKPSALEEASKTMKGNITWAAYEGTYFMTGVIPEENEGISLKLSAEGEKIRTLLIGIEDVIPAKGHLQYN